LPLLNTLILLSRSVTVTVAHHKLLAKDKIEDYLFITIILGLLFSGLQLVEYIESSFSLTDSYFGSRFFVTTGFHGLHVVIGTLFLFVILIRRIINTFNSSHHQGFEFRAIYYHFVDVVWVFLYLILYC
jgi:heme/copper-type cytochrome/quinol oxidase subunit 3